MTKGLKMAICLEWLQTLPRSSLSLLNLQLISQALVPSHYLAGSFKGYCDAVSGKACLISGTRTGLTRTASSTGCHHLLPHSNVAAGRGMTSFDPVLSILSLSRVVYRPSFLTLSLFPPASLSSAHCVSSPPQCLCTLIPRPSLDTHVHMSEFSRVYQ
jgi:hypothetical protein